jgi:pimeloyl-ACP methyl ester carboxylesterase
MPQVTSRDGTLIDFDRQGQGAAVVLVSGGSVDRSSNAPLAARLAEHFAVLNYDRRGRGPSGDAPEYAVEREVEDIAVVAEAAGGSAFLFGSSSGAALALIAAGRLPNIAKLALWEPPYILDGSRPRPPADTARVFREFVAAGNRGGAVEHFMLNVVGLPPEFAANARTQPWWAAQEALAHTLAYDAEVMGDYSLPIEQIRAVRVPTLVLDGGASYPWIRDTAQAVVDHLEVGQHRTLPGQQHNFDPGALASALAEFFQA